MSGSTPPGWDAPVTALRGVGPERARLLERLEIRTVGDLLLHRPRRYEDRRAVRSVRDLTEKGMTTVVRGRVVAAGVKYFRQRTRSVFELVIDDGTGRLHCRWWGLPYLEDHYRVGQDLMVYGRVTEVKPRSMDHPETEVLEEGDEPLVHLGRIVPVYPSTEGVPQRWLRNVVWGLVGSDRPAVPDPHPQVATGGLMNRAEAIAQLHFPESEAAAEAARARLAYDEFVGFQWEIQGRRRRLYARAKGLCCRGDNRWIRPFLGRLGFALTESQTVVLREIRRDLEGGVPMRRLVQGDVGSGKTVVAAAAALIVMECGFDVAIMAPTEILARQHAARFREWLAGLAIDVELRVRGGREGVDAEADAEARPEVKTAAERGVRPCLTVGTHALLEDGYEPRRLGLVVIDEQHKFGVAQRELLVRKGAHPHLLVMTATPIPRTLALTLYGDLDVSTIRLPPPGRGRVRTFVRGRERLPKVWEFVREQIVAGRQAFVVYPRVDGGEAASPTEADSRAEGGREPAGEVRAAVREYGSVKKALAPHAVGLLHGRMSSAEKDRVMGEFRERRLQVLLSTSVVEVGVDVAAASVMVVENAEHFGLAQLHQLRGRVGRGAADGYCVLVVGKETPEIRERLRVLEETEDGFAIAEADLRLRGPGELLGQSQSGLPPFRFADLGQDRELLEYARGAVSTALEGASSAGG